MQGIARSAEVKRRMTLSNPSGLNVPVEGRSALAKNTVAMVLIQAANYVFPLVLLPLFARQLGLVEYGRLAFCFALIQTAGVFTDYGFGLSASYRISKWKKRSSYVNRILSAVYFHKSCLSIACAIAVGIFALSEDDVHLSQLLYWSIFAILAQSLLPVWLFQGLERMAALASIILISRVAYFVPCLLLIREANDSHIAIISLGTSQLIAGIGGAVLWRAAGYRWQWPGSRFARAVFYDSTPFFASRASLLTYTSFGAVFLGLLAGPAQVAMYSAIEQLYRGAIGLVGMASQALYPYMARTRDFVLLARVVRGTLGLSCLAVIVALLFGEQIIKVVYGDEFLSSSGMVPIFGIVFAITCPSIVLGYPFLASVSRLSLANRSIYVAGIIQAMLLVILYIGGYASAANVGMCVMIAEAAVLILRVKWARQYWPNRAYFGGVCGRV